MPRPRPKLRLPPGRVRLYAVTAGIALLACGCAGVLIALGMAQEAPSWWSASDWAAPQAGRSASDLENRLLSSVYRARAAAPEAEEAPDPDAPVTWTVPVSAADANAWLNARLPRWIRNQSETFQWPEQIEELQVEFRDDQILVGVKVRYQDSSQFLSATLKPVIQETDGSLWMPARGVSVGRLPLPASWVLSSESISMAEQRIPENIRDLPETRSLAAAFAGQIPVVQSPVIKLADGRRVRLLSLTSKNGTLEVTCQTEPRRAQ